MYGKGGKIKGVLESGGRSMGGSGEELRGSGGRSVGGVVGGDSEEIRETLVQEWREVVNEVVGE